MQSFSKSALELYSKGYCVSSVTNDYQRWIVCTPLRVNVFITLATQQRLDYIVKLFFEAACIIGAGRSIDWVKQQGREADHLHPSSAHIGLYFHGMMHNYVNNPRNTYVFHSSQHSGRSKQRTINVMRHLNQLSV
jgi:hypothetical protein